MQSGVKKLTNANVLRDHIQEIKQAFYKFANQHGKLVDEQQETQRHNSKPTSQKSPQEQESSSSRVTELESEVEQLKRQLAERDALIVKLTKLRSSNAKPSAQRDSN